MRLVYEVYSLKTCESVRPQEIGVFQGLVCQIDLIEGRYIVMCSVMLQ